MKCHRATGLLVALMLSLPVMAADTPAPGARDIVQNVNAAEHGDNISNEIAITVLDDKGNRRESGLKSYTRKSGDNRDETRTVMFYVFPHTYRDIGFLTIDYNDAAKEGKRWMYVPTTRKTKQIADKDKYAAFMGSDFSYADMSLQHLGNDDFRLLKEDIVAGQKVWVIEGTPPASVELDENGYSKSVYTVRQDNFMIISATHYVNDGSRVKNMAVTRAEQVGGHWVPAEVSMETHRNGRFLSRTTLQITNTKFDNHFDENFFEVRQLAKGAE
ncbi:MAG TPA: outer membrane lipoprotein-sorting protein [Pseudomonadales bacterium]|nr:outer membrane lipoprotein-sorting protein [Pseudomonadales bacterium]